MEALRKTKSVCPRCLRSLPATLERGPDGSVWLSRTCPEHGKFRALIWRGLADFDRWRGGADAFAEEECVGSCRSCAVHPQGTCCALLEVTRRCNLNCTYCFAHDGCSDVPMAELKHSVDIILSRGNPLIQLSGGEPTLRDDLPKLITYIRAHGGRYVQLNTNGLRLAEDEAYVRALADAGLNIVFLQFDGVNEDVYIKLRNRPLLEIKNRAIELCGRHGLGVTLVPTVVRGVNDGQIGEIIRYGAFLSPVVRGVHFQPVSYFGRYPGLPAEQERYTLDELIDALASQTGLDRSNFAPSHCDHPACGLHGSFITDEFGELTPLTHWDGTSPLRFTSAAGNRAYIGTRWSAARPGETSDATPDSLDGFLQRAGRYSFTVTAMAFQDAMTLDFERLCRCSLHVYENGRLIPFCAKYLTKVE